MRLLYTGKAKNIYEYDQNHVVMEFTDQATAFNGQKHDLLSNKGYLNNQITILIFKYLHSRGIKTHFIKALDDLQQLCLKVDIIPLEVICRNIIAGSMAQRLGIAEGVVPSEAIFELSYKNDALNDPLINDYHAIALGVVTKEQLSYLYTQTKLINEYLQQLFLEIDLKLVDFKLEFGITSKGEIILADEFSPDNCRLWDVKTNEKFDKDRFRRELGDVMTYYEEVYRRLEVRLDAQY